MAIDWKKQIEKDLLHLKTQLEAIKGKVLDIEESDLEHRNTLIDKLTRLSDKPQKQSLWKDISIFLIGGFSFVLLIIFLSFFY